MCPPFRAAAQNMHPSLPASQHPETHPRQAVHLHANTVPDAVITTESAYVGRGKDPG